MKKKSYTAQLEAICQEKRNKFGNISKSDELRLQRELQQLEKGHTAECIYYLYQLIKMNHLHPLQYNLRGKGAGLYVCYLLGLSHVNPTNPQLPLYSQFAIGIHGEKTLSVDLNLDKTIYEQVTKSLPQLPGVLGIGREAVESGWHPYKYIVKLNDGEIAINLIDSKKCAENYLRYQKSGKMPADEDLYSEKMIFAYVDSLQKSHCVDDERMLEIVQLFKPNSFPELVKAKCLAQGTGIWTDDTKQMVLERSLGLMDLITNAEDVYEMLMRSDLSCEEEKAFELAEMIRRGDMQKSKQAEKICERMRQHGVPECHINSCAKVEYLFARAHVAEMLYASLYHLW